VPIAAAITALGMIAAEIWPGCAAFEHEIGCGCIGGCSISLDVCHQQIRVRWRSSQPQRSANLTRLRSFPSTTPPEHERLARPSRGADELGQKPRQAFSRESARGFEGDTYALVPTGALDGQ
jgi:hypothetical protein